MDPTSSAMDLARAAAEMTPAPSPPAPSGMGALADGRVIAWDDYGDPDGEPVVFMHGVPSCRLLGADARRSAGEAGVRLVVPDRPGCGVSTFQPGRRVTDWPRDVSALVDLLGLDHYSVLGVSGGGPYALACAAHGDPRLKRTAVVSGIGPLDTSGALAGLYETNRALFEAAARGVDQVLPMIEGLRAGHGESASSQRALMASLGAEDRQVLVDHPEVLAALLDMNAAATVHGIEGLAYDTWLTTQAWGFDLAAIAGPVDFYGADHDRNVPVQHTVDQAGSVTRSTLTVWPEAGHLAIVRRLTEVLARLTRRGR